MPVWDASDSANAIEVGTQQFTVEGEITADEVMEKARSEGIKNFTVEDEEGNELSQDDFPVNGNVSVNEYNENA